MAVMAGTVTHTYCNVVRLNGSTHKVDPFLILGEKNMFAGYLYPYYRWGVPGYGYPIGYPTWGNLGSVNYGSNVIGSAIANQGFVNTGTLVGNTTQTASPTVIW
jgi:hypothetical protein